MCVLAAAKEFLLSLPFKMLFVSVYIDVFVIVVIIAERFSFELLAHGPLAVFMLASLARCSALGLQRLG